MSIFVIVGVLFEGAFSLWVYIKLLSRLQLGLSHFADRKFRHNFQDRICYVCACGENIENNRLTPLLREPSLCKKNSVSKDKSNWWEHCKLILKPFSFNTFSQCSCVRYCTRHIYKEKKQTNIVTKSWSNQIWRCLAISASELWRMDQILASSHYLHRTDSDA